MMAHLKRLIRLKRNVHVQAKTLFSYLHIRYLFLSWLAVFVGSWIIYMGYSSFTERCCGHECKNAICNEFHKGALDGSICKRLCEKDTVYFKKCLSAKVRNQIYSVTLGKEDGVMKCQMTEEPDFELEPWKESTSFMKPTKETSVKKFSEMVFRHLKEKIGDQANLQELVTMILRVTDSNKDGQVSHLEAQSVWALLQVNEFMVSIVLQGREPMPKVLGFCGDLYIMETVPYVPLYGTSLPWFVDLWIPASVRSSQTGSSPWPEKAKIAIGLFEFVEDIFHGTFGNFLMCDVSAAGFGYSERRDVKVVDAGNIVPEVAFQEVMREKPCERETDCLYGKDCLTSCDLTKHRCSTEVARPNLSKVCSTLKDYLLYAAPPNIKDELEKQLYACIALNAEREQMEMKHSLILNNLKTLLWKMISHTKETSLNAV